MNRVESSSNPALNKFFANAGRSARRFTLAAAGFVKNTGDDKASVFGKSDRHDILKEALKTGQTIDVGLSPGSPSHRVQDLIENSDVNDSHALFCELLELATQGPKHWPVSWKERARWIKYEEQVELEANRFSHPYLTLLNHRSILQLRNCLKKGAFLVDAHVRDYDHLVEKLVDRWVQMRQLGDEETAETKMVQQVLSLPKQHLVHDKIKQVLSTKKISNASSNALLRSSSADMSGKGVSFTLTPPRNKSTEESSRGAGLKGLMRKLPPNCEASALLIGQVQELKHPVAGFVRLEKAMEMYPELPDIPVPLRFLFVLLVPLDQYTDDLLGIGSTMGALMVDEVFRQVAYNAVDSIHLSDGVEEFLGQTIILPAGKWSKDFRWEPIDDMPTVTRAVGQGGASKQVDVEDEKQIEEEESETTEGLQRTGRIFGGLVQDVKRKAAWYVSDFVDVCRAGRITQSLAAAIFLFFSNITKIITLGGLMGNLLDQHMAAVENLLAGGICGVIYALTAGQPLTALSATGPTLIFEAILYGLCLSFGWNYLPFRCWIGFWTAFFILILVAFDASAIVALITRFTEEAFATLISVIFIIQAFEELFHLRHETPITTDPVALLNDPCNCHIDTIVNNQSLTEIVVDINIDECQALNGTSMGAQCHFQPDVFLFSCLLFIGTFFIAMGTKFVRHSGFFPHSIRHMIADFGVLMAIVIMTAVNHAVGLNVHTLPAPESLTPTHPDRDWFISPVAVDAWYIPFFAALPALFFTILVVMDQQITAVIVNRKDNKLKKGYGYHLDLFMISVLMIICSLIGVPFFVADTVISIMHVDSLRRYSECSAPGEKPQFLGVNEQRVTAFVAHLMIGLAVFLKDVIKLIPLPVLLGIFLYMGISALIGQQLVQRIFIIFMPMKHQPDYSWLRKVHLKRVHLFTAVQVLSLIALFVIKHTKKISIIFPIMLIFMVIIRKLLDHVFTQKELHALDDPLPRCRDLLRPVRHEKTDTTQANGPHMDEEQGEPSGSGRVEQQTISNDKTTGPVCVRFKEPSDSDLADEISVGQRDSINSGVTITASQASDGDLKKISTD